ncbi:MAG: hypothetical protein MUE73_18670 [Planctomycetes bacterium]|nr:hypothetical protein [Planctomycetota bacterium]
MHGAMKIGSGSWVRGAAMVLLIGLLLFLPVAATAGKPSSPPPSGKWIYYTAGGGLWKMASDGSNMTSLPGTWGWRMSDVRYDDSYWAVRTEVCGRTPEGYQRYKLIVGPAETSGTPIVLLDDANVNPIYYAPTFRPGTTPRVTFSAVVWDEYGAFSAGLYQVTFSTDGETIGDPELLLACDTFDDWLNPDYTETVPQLTHHDWLDEDTLVYGDHAYQYWGNGGSLQAQLYMGDIDDDPSYHTALIADGQPLMGFGVHFNADGSKVIYNCAYTGIYEVATGGNSTPVRWVADLQAGPIDWLDDDTIVYQSFSYRKNRHDLYKMKRGGGATCLTKDVTGGAQGCGVR